MTFFSKITRPATAIVLAASVALSPVAATEAQAGNEEALIAGAIGTIILGAIATQALNGNVRIHSNTQSHYVPRQQPTYRHGSQAGRYGNQHGGNRGGNHGGSRAKHFKQLPARCIVNVPGERGVLFGNRCLQRNFRGAAYLPGYCKDHVYNSRNGNVRNVYRGRCLKQAGYSVAGR
ncbi:hypothetical protein [Maritimibacter sp. UBA3975]|uniref:hypothetical protein n=1 Tax=Maritimibacter sp. UBA3975 TaxID=1946833 RepID=UPI000C0966A1|nr:hypothetical protein [Maritimibacter sp. UBA3975]MAM63236.1 hypothetical protein [Maritimibacter sp.]|tara:strand:+ start:7663 stop:8193 length:531 start_codon:yes stop_codon:yes gene_type:complete